MGKHYISAKAICPWYKHEDLQVIYCLGFDDESTLHIAFSNAKDAKEYKCTHCYRTPRKCPLYDVLSEVWG